MPRERGARARELGREAWRNFASGTTKGLLAALVAMLVIIIIGGLQTRAVIALSIQAHTYRNAGADITVMTLENGVDGASCDALAGSSGILASGAVRSGVKTSFAAMPNREVDTFEATAGFAQVLGIGREGSGGWLSADLAHTLGAQPGSLTPLTDKRELRVQDIFDYPDDGRDQKLAYATVLPVPADGVFDACWAEVTTDRASGLLRLAAINTQDELGSSPVFSQLNSTLGSHFDGPSLLAERGKAPLILCCALGAALGLVVIRIRRLELASTLHAGMTKIDLYWQILLETGLWAGLAVLASLPVCYVLAVSDNPDPWFPAAVPALESALAVALGSLVGALVTTATTRESHLFRYFKNR